MKKNLHPKWYLAKVYCENKLIFEVGSTKEQLNVDIWSGNNSFYINILQNVSLKNMIQKLKKKI